MRLHSIAPIPSLFAHAVELLAWITADEGGSAVRGTDMPATEIHAFITGNATAEQPSPSDDPEQPTRPTTREQEVASLIMAGLSHRQIAGKLYVSQCTAESHVQNVLTKLGFSSRAQVAAYMATNQRRTGCATRPPEGRRRFSPRRGTPRRAAVHREPR